MRLSMSKRSKRVLLVFLILCALLVVVTTAVIVKLSRQQLADPNFDAKVTHPAYTTQHPKVLIDEAHNNFHTASGRYKPFADLISNDGYQILPNKQKFQQKALNGYDILVIANALGAMYPFLPGADRPAFTEEECDAVRDWVNAGGSLLLISDHAPTGGAAKILSGRFDVDMSTGVTGDDEHSDQEIANPGWLIFIRENGLLVDHPITIGRSTTERINRVETFTGQSLKGPEGSTPFLKLSEKAYDAFRDKEISAAGRAQAVALKFGKGRVVVTGEAAFLSAQVEERDGRRVQFGMNRAGYDDRQLALNIMHWLSGLLN